MIDFLKKVLFSRVMRNLCFKILRFCLFIYDKIKKSRFGVVLRSQKKSNKKYYLLIVIFFISNFFD